MIDLDIEMDAGDKARVDRLIDGLARGLSGHGAGFGAQAGLRSLLIDTVKPYLQERAVERFERQGDDASGRWAQLAPATQRFRKYYANRDGLSIGPAGPINVRVGYFKDYVTQTHSIRYSERFAQLTIPSNKPIGRGMFLSRKLRHAQLGGTGMTGRKFPARPVAVINGRDKTAIDRFTVDWVNELLRTLQ